MAQRETQDALYSAIEAAAIDVMASKSANILQKSVALRDLSLAYRYALPGTAQPGSVFVEK